ncbi:hypothetical protein ACT3TS_01275 [Specibacter sp. AOP5-B1-6]|uniref:hypothetical protein n=1 Tax=Specibacter sp. AOP5-B1-6 TaxID=3457653 RepID=UPI003FB65D57
MSHSSPGKPSGPYEPHHNNLIRDRKRMRSQYGPYSYTRGVYVNGSETPLKPRNIRIQSSIPIVFAVVFAGFGVYMAVKGLDLAGTIGLFCGAVMFLFLSWIGFRTARLREKWERENPEQAKNIKY